MEDFSHIKPLDPTLRPEDETGVLGTLSQILDYVTRPSKALWSGVYNLTDEDPETGFLSGAYKGLTGEADKELADVLGIKRPSSDQGWGEWGGRGLAHLILNAGGDPFTYLFAPAKGAAIAGKGLKALSPFYGASRGVKGLSDTLGLGLKEGQSLAGKLGEVAHLPQAAERVGQATGLSKALRSGPPDEMTAQVVEASQRLLQDQKQEILQSLKASKEAEKTLAMPIAEARELWETAGQSLKPVQARQYLKQHGLTDEVIDAYDAQHNLMESFTTQYNKLAFEKGFEPISRIGEIETRHVPRVATAETQERLAQLNRATAPLQPEDFFSLELRKLIDPATGTPVKWPGTNNPVIRKAGMLDVAEDGTHLWQGKPVQMVLPTLKDIEAGIPKLKGAFVEGAAESYAADAMKKLTQINWMEHFFQPLEQSGRVKRIIKGQPLEAGMREIQVPGLTEYAAEGKLADYIENSAVQNFNWSTPVDAYTKFLRTFNRTGLGAAVKDFNRWWKNNILPLSLRFHGGNVTSNQFMEYLYGKINPLNIPVRDYQYAMIQAGKGQDIIRGINNVTLRDEMRKRGFAEWAGAGMGEAEDTIAKAIKGPGRTQRLVDMIPVEKGGTADKTVQWIPKAAEKWGELNQAGFHVGRIAEENARGAIALDWLLKNYPDVSTLSKGELASVLDRAARMGKNAMIDYAQQSPFMRELTNIMPFAKWTVGSTKLFKDLLLEDPARIGRLDRFLNTAVTPLSPEEKKVAEPWQIENLPLTGVMGMQLPRSPEGFKSMVLAGRFLPTNTVEMLANRPLQGLAGMISPALKAPIELTTDYSTFKEGPIDREAKGLFANILNPLTGKPYEKSRSYTLGWNPPAAVNYAISQSPASLYQQYVQTIQPYLGFQDPYKAEQSGMETAAYIGTGGKLFPFDMEKQTRRRQREASDVELTMTRNMKDTLRKASAATDPGAYKRAMNDYEFYREQRDQARLNRMFSVVPGS